ncbi:MAG TPA: trypsin-like peptidase domain-containing protein [bacterium]|nr:trypsin-like peptidase domain-containing protein [bacterium]
MRRTVSGCIAVLFLASGCLLSIPTAKAQDVEVVVANAKSSVAVILAKGPKGVFSGTGFFIGNGLVLTANHVVQGATQIALKFPEYPAVQARLVRSSQANDVAVLSIPNLPVRPLSLGDINRTHEGETVVVIGFPRIEDLGTATATVTVGIVSAIRANLLQIQAPVSPGNSGGPVFNLQGDVIGIVRGTLRGEQQGINFAAAINSARLLLGGTALAPLPAASSPIPPPPIPPSPNLPQPTVPTGSPAWSGTWKSAVTGRSGVFVANFIVTNEEVYGGRTVTGSMGMGGCFGNLSISGTDSTGIGYGQPHDIVSGIAQGNGGSVVATFKFSIFSQATMVGSYNMTGAGTPCDGDHGSILATFR